ncbi:hypothetical protein [Sphaerotilus sp.]|uniref:hypothetical protein n=1 Tax=Sphaerotilus sp. TaxID=2093942 RepID=UPI00286E2C53|nr:hypothetical protein [Sphaerotilus sp.]
MDDPQLASSDDEVEHFEAGEPADVVPPMSPPVRRLAAVMWPAFLMAGVLEMLVFSLVDPGELHWLGGAAVEADHKAVYTVAFFAFWVVIALGSALTQLILVEPNVLNKPYRNHL